MDSRFRQGWLKAMGGMPPILAALGLLSAPARAGWQFEGAKPAAEKQAESGSAPDSLPDAAPAPARPQVFGSGRMKEPDAQIATSDGSTTPERAETVDAYERVLREDRAAEKDEAQAADDQEFERVRSRPRARRVAEGNEEAPAEGLPAPAKKPAARAVRAPRGPVTEAESPRPAPKATAPRSPELETEVITPQKATRGTGPKASPESEAEARGNELNAAFPYTHLLPSPFNLPRGQWTIGSTVAYGLLDFLQVSTNVARTLLGHWNVQAKVPLVEFPTFVASAYVNYESYNPHSIDDSNPDLRINRWQPGLVTGYEIDRDMAFFLGGNFNFGQDPIPVKTTSGYLHGAQVEADWSWLYNPSTSRLGDNAISAGVTYDLTYDLLGFGLTHHWRSFELGLHYTLADRNRFLPIFGFSAGGSF